MTVNNSVVSYILMMVLSLGICVPAAIAGWFAAGKWKAQKTAALQDHTEKTVYLVITLLCLGFSLRLFMIPLWFLTLQSLIPSIPGAMCMAGIHLLDPPFSFIATSLKLFIPLGFIYWLILNSMDRRIESQPFMVRKLMLVMLLAIIMIAESFFDLHFLLSIKPKIVSCCTSIFDLPHSKTLKFVRQSGMIWMISFYFLLVVTLLFSELRFRSERIAKSVPAVFSLSALILLVLMLHTKISPVMLETPYHQCVFCLWQGMPDIAIATIAALTGLWFVFVFSVLPEVKKYPLAERLERKLLKFALLLCLSGATWITIRYAVKYLFFS